MDTLAKASSSQTALTKALEATNIGKEVSNSISKAMKVSDVVNICLNLTMNLRLAN